MQDGPKAIEQPRYSLKQWLMFGFYPIIKTLTIPILQPIAVVAAKQQKGVTSASGLLSLREAIVRILQNRGWRGFYAGTAASMTREGIKSSYKGPLQLIANDLAISLIPSSMFGSYFSRGIIAGVFVGLTEPFIGGIFERYKTFCITQESKTNFFTFVTRVYRQQQHEHFMVKISGFINEMYRGLGVTMGKQTLMNVAFFTTKPWADNAVKPYKREHPVLSVTLASLAPGISAALVGAPLDVFKTLIQCQMGETKSVTDLLKSVLKQSGWRGLLAGVPARFVLISTGYGVTAGCLNFFESLRSASTRSSAEQTAPSVECLAAKLNNLSLNSPVTTHEQPRKEPLMMSRRYQPTTMCPFSGSDITPAVKEDISQSTFRFK